MTKLYSPRRISDPKKLIAEKNPESVDLYEKLAYEKFLVDNPRQYFASVQQQKSAYTDRSPAQQSRHGAWIYHPWSNRLFHILPREEYLLLRTVRNRDILSAKDQRILASKTIAVAGLSVGLNILMACIRLGIGASVRIADSDFVALSNVNRSLYSLLDFGKPKYTVALELINAIDPFIPVLVFRQGLNTRSLTQFLSGANIVIDAFDNFNLKIQLRQLAKQKKIPVVSGFDVENGVLLIVERYDMDANLNLDLFLNGYTASDLQKKPLTVSQKTDLFVNIIGKSYHSRKMLTSVRAVGQRVTGYPQLITATSLAAASFTLAVKRVLLKEHMPSERIFIPLDQLVGNPLN